ncbi:LysR family transcriptional regulator [Methylobacterium sp. Leaf118]|uniref:LysR family transcriptional regulator n=1 Tax=Methylobacterium sp. Leaf118 TaxID=2876562 RepID=UPI001E4E3B57|nr:LysR family transcriptional regulator [Methylobacterium sp. Leaf118]
MDLDWLEDFLALAERRTFSRAAEVRNVTQPAFSRRIRALEDWMGSPLFTRSAQGANLTPAGAQFEPAARELMRDLHRARRETRAAGARETATLAIAATHALSFTFFPGWIREAMRKTALGTLNLVSDSLEACERILQSGEVHVLLCHLHRDAPLRLDADRYESLRVGHDVLAPFCAPDAAGRALWLLPGSVAHPIPVLAYSPASGLGRILAACRTGEAAQTETRFTSHLAATLTTMAREGHGVAWLPHSMVSDDETHGRLVRAGPAQFDIPVEIRLFRSLDHRSPAADALWSHLCAVSRVEDDNPVKPA